ncbi:MAG: FAD-binding protein [Coriobacteriales bacterium]|nr:FAD-binding protein [Coriobacteriales bacterium]
MTDQILASRRTFVKGMAVAAGTATLAGASSLVNTAMAVTEPSYTPGTYTATQEGVGTVTVSITVNESSITDCTVDVSGETPFVGGLIGGILQNSILEAGDGTFDSVSGATITSWAVAQAVQRCLEQAAGREVSEPLAWDDSSDQDWLGSEPVIPIEAVTETWETSILIVGAGNGGLAAAAYAAANDLDFRIIERNPMKADTRLYYGAVDTAAAQEAGVEPMDRKRLLAEISRYASGRCNQRVINVWINESAAMHEFVNSLLTAEPYGLACRFTAGDAAKWPEADSVTNYFCPEIEHTFGGWSGEPTRNVVFEDFINAHGYKVDYCCQLVKLIKDGDRVTGAIAQDRTDGHFIQINAERGVLLACGGYAANPRMMKALDPMAVSCTTMNGNFPGQRGMGIRAALWAGATLDNDAAPMLFDRGLVANNVNAGYVENPAAFGGAEFPGFITNSVNIGQYKPGSQPFLKVNREGVRFANESCPYNDINYAATYQPGGVYAMVHDANFFEDAVRFHTIACSASVQRGTYFEDVLNNQVAAGLIQKADTIEELADKLGFEGEAKDNFLATVERQNENFDAQNDPDFGKMVPRLSEIRTAPFYGGWLGASILTTLQGITIDEHMRALDAQRNPIEGLYVAGDNSGSFFADNYPCLLSGIACGRTLTFAIHAVKEMGGLA